MNLGDYFAINMHVNKLCLVMHVIYIFKLYEPKTFYL